MTATAAVPTMVTTLLAKAKDRTAVFGVVGLGYVGLPLAMEIVRAGYRVIGFDVNVRVVDLLNGGRSHIQDVSGATVADAVKAKKFSATADLARLSEPDVISISVPTPLMRMATLGSKPMSSGASTVAPNMAMTCCTPSAAVCAQDRRSSGATTAPGGASTGRQRGKRLMRVAPALRAIREKGAAV